MVADSSQWHTAAEPRCSGGTIALKETVHLARGRRDSAVLPNPFAGSKAGVSGLTVVSDCAFNSVAGPFFPDPFHFSTPSSRLRPNHCVSSCVPKSMLERWKRWKASVCEHKRCSCWLVPVSSPEELQRDCKCGALIEKRLKVIGFSDRESLMCAHVACRSSFLPFVLLKKTVPHYRNHEAAEVDAAW